MSNLRAKPSRRSNQKSVAEVTDLKLTNPQRVLYPDSEITKVELAQFYLDIGPWIMPHVAT